MRGNTKHLVFSVCVAFVLCAFASVASARTIYVPDDYEKIQWAVDNASDGDTIIVRDGIYLENIKVDKRLMLRSEKGSEKCIVQAYSYGSVFHVTADHVNISGFTIKGGYIGIDLDHAENCNIANNNISNNDWGGISLRSSDKNSIKGNSISNNEDGIILAYSSSNNITGNNISNNEVDGIFLWYSSENSIRGNNISNNKDDGIHLYDSSENSIKGNKISNNDWGIHLYNSSENSIKDNSISSNGGGISLLYSSSNTITGNIMTNDGVFIRGYELSHWNTHKIENNTVNGKPLYYFRDMIGCKVPEDAGQVIIANCSGIIIENLNIRNTDVGIEIGFSSQNTIKNNNVSDNWYGIYLSYSSENSINDNKISNNDWSIHLYNSSENSINDNKISNNDWSIELCDSSKNSITGNKISNSYYDGIYLSYSSENSINDNKISNNGDGIVLWNSSNNLIYLNNFINNTKSVYSHDSTNVWNSTSQMTYIYEGRTYTNYLGNYWSDYTGSDEDGDGIGDIPYIIDSDRDNYPLIERFENYFVPKEAKTFDTGRPENPYPSISGKFIGTIKTNTKIIARKLYTYACEETGGHTEYALIWNETWCAYAEWEGYKEDWMNISFNKTVILMPYETYNITIVTGSYPQIHHTSSLKTENGWINCTEFTDANGKKYENWIPAIKLWS